jgi:hypothetical protein
VTDGAGVTVEVSTDRSESGDMTDRMAGLQITKRGRPLGRLVSYLAVAVAATALALSGWGASASAQSGGEQIHLYQVDILVGTDGDLGVVELIEYDFGAAVRHGIVRDIPTRLRFDDRSDRVLRLEDIKVTAARGTPTDHETEDLSGGLTRIRIGDPDQTITGRHAYRLEYQVKGALNGFADHDELYWNAVGHDWPVPIQIVTATVRFAKGVPQGDLEVACFAGARGSQLPCAESRADGGGGTFGAEDLGAYEGLTVVVGFPNRRPSWTSGGRSVARSRSTR